MFSRFRNIFSKNKSEADGNVDLETDAIVDPNVVTTRSDNVASGVASSSIEEPKLEGLNFLKSLVESEKNPAKPMEPMSNGKMAGASFSQEVEDLLNDKLSDASSNNENQTTSDENEGVTEGKISDSVPAKSVSEGVKIESTELKITETSEKPLESSTQELSGSSIEEEKVEPSNEMDNVQDILHKMKTEVVTLNYETKETSPLLSENKNPLEITNTLTDESPLNPALDEIDNAQLSSNEDSIKAQLTLNSETKEASPLLPESTNLHKITNTLTDESPLNTVLNETDNSQLSSNENSTKAQTETVALNHETKECSPLLSASNDSIKTQQTEKVTKTLSENSEKSEHETLSKESLGDNSQLPSPALVELMPEICKTTKVNSWVEENNAISTPPTPYPLISTESANNLNNNSSVVIEDLPSEITAPSPSMESSISGSSNNTNSTITTTTTTGTMDSTTTRLATDPTKIVVQPVGSNGLACSAITGKLTDIAEVAESLDSVIRDIQENSQRAEVESNATSPRDKKLGTLRSTSSEDWHSRSTEDDSFVTASEGRTSSYMSCNKSSFDYSEGDDSTLAFDMPDVNSPFNMSFDESEQSFISAQQDTNKTPTKLSDSGDGPLDEEDLEDPSSLADIEDLHSESVTPTPAETEELYVDSIPIESETELEVSGIVDAPTMDVLTECAAPPLSVTPEVSSSSCSKQCQTHDDDDDNDDASATTSSANNSQSSANTLNTNSNATKPNAAWRRSKYYENITKQTIKGFL